MPNARVQFEERQRRLQTIEPLRDYLDSHGIQRAWFANKLGISKQRLFYYLRGDNEAPEWFLPRAWQIISNPRVELPPPPPPPTNRRKPRNRLMASGAHSTRGPPHHSPSVSRSHPSHRPRSRGAVSHDPPTSEHDSRDP